MAYQAQVNGKAKRQHPGAAFRENVSGLLHDVIELGELQTRLFLVDLNEAKRGSIVPILLGVGSFCLALASVPILLAGLAWALVEYAEWDLAAAFTVTAIVALVVAGCMAWSGWRLMSRALGKLSRSRDELATNVAWIKSALKQRDSLPSSAHDSDGDQYSSFQERKPQL